jgi:general secretion pathway protein E
MSEALRAAVAAKAGHHEIESLAKTEGMVPLAEHARGLARQGITTMAEALRVVELEG